MRRALAILSIIRNKYRDGFGNKRRLFRWLGMVAACSVLAFSLYQIGSYYWDMYKNEKKTDLARSLYKEASAANNNHGGEDDVPVMVEIDGEERPIQSKFVPLVEKYSDIVGWIKIDGTKVNYPVVQGEDNDFYLNRDLDGEHNVNGSIFMDYRNELGKDRNYILYGHNMKNGTMFGDLLRYESRWYFETNNVIRFDTIYEDWEFHIFSVRKTDIHDNYLITDFASDEEFQKYIDEVKSQSLHKNEIYPTVDDILLTLSTCHASSNDNRFVVHAVLVKKTKEEPQAADGDKIGDENASDQAGKTDETDLQQLLEENLRWLKEDMEARNAASEERAGSGSGSGTRSGGNAGNGGSGSSGGNAGTNSGSGSAPASAPQPAPSAPPAAQAPASPASEPSVPPASPSAPSSSPDPQPQAGDSGDQGGAADEPVSSGDPVNEVPPETPPAEEASAPSDGPAAEPPATGPQPEPEPVQTDPPGPGAEDGGVEEQLTAPPPLLPPAG